ncbi:glutamate--tRNA ligase [Polyangium sorediatum]|uniref:Glutamate--tRNA ligase n=2 Tax=Polyangium sorediatum TaxID=889274 RepID=A0ABT6NZM1_9BACT|nr:glutamate--tRNA ligase [Polyangium sorediatum]MDI1433749.1 glutamate--tRNA ligase [Polyangium sorediatum]
MAEHAAGEHAEADNRYEKCYSAGAMAQGKPRVRFAPSPTGYLHIGGVRTALFNWLWARKTGGTFVLRIEDTDQERSTPENEAIILRELRWLGLGWDEGPEVGGEHGPYRQMERLPLYQEYVAKLIAAGAAYRCYCTKEELDAQREALKARDPKAQFRYPGTCRDRTGPAPDRPFVIRFRAPSSGAVTYRDLVFGEVVTPNNTQQDAVLMRADGVPLYNLGAVIDDITMGITLVARGRDHMINTPPQILLYQALGAQVPQFAHLPMMLAPSGEKLSKRYGAVSVGEYRERGISAVGLLNYLVRFGWSFGDEEIFSMQDLVQKFSWENCSKADGKFDTKKLAAIAFEQLKSPALTPDDVYLDSTLPFLEKRGFSGVDREAVRAILPLIRERAQTYADAADALDYFFRDLPVYDEKAVKKFLVADKAPHLKAVRDLFASIDDFSAKNLEARFGELLTEKKLEIKDVAQPVRVAVSGRTATPGLFDVLALVGKPRVLARLDHALGLIAASSGAG